MEGLMEHAITLLFISDKQKSMKEGSKTKAPTVLMAFLISALG